MIRAIFGEPAKPFWFEQPEARLGHDQVSAFERVDECVQGIVT